MRKIGDFIVCKKSFYKDFGSNIEKINRIFKKPHFRKGQKYKIDNIYVYFYTNSGSTYASCPPPNASYYCFNIKKGIITLNDKQLNEYFYSKIEERNLKLKKLKTL